MRAPFFVTAATGTADLLAAELAALGIEGAREVQGGVTCEGELAAAYRACLESRLALRVLWQIARFPVADAAALYAGVGETDWAAHMDASGTLAVDFSGAVAGHHAHAVRRAARQGRDRRPVPRARPAAVPPWTATHRRCASTRTPRAAR